MKKYVFNDKQGNRDRECIYGIVFDGEFFSRKEAEDKKLAVFKSLKWEKAGKWSNTTWEVVVKSAKLVVCMRPFNGWPHDLDECVKHVKESSKSYTGETITDEEAICFLKGAYPKLYQNLIEIKKKEDDLI